MADLSLPIIEGLGETRIAGCCGMAGGDPRGDSARGGVTLPR